MKYEVKFTTQFKRDLKLAKRQGKNIDNYFEYASEIKLLKTEIYENTIYSVRILFR